MFDKMELVNFKSLIKKVRTLSAILVELHAENKRLTDKIRELKENSPEEGILEKTKHLENEVRKLKKENRILREREKLVKEKMERLVVKLEEINL